MTETTPGYPVLPREDRLRNAYETGVISLAELADKLAAIMSENPGEAEAAVEGLPEAPTKRRGSWRQYPVDLDVVREILAAGDQGERIRAAQKIVEDAGAKEKEATYLRDMALVAAHVRYAVPQLQCISPYEPASFRKQFSGYKASDKNKQGVTGIVHSTPAGDVPEFSDLKIADRRRKALMRSGGGLSDRLANLELAWLDRRKTERPAATARATRQIDRLQRQLDKADGGTDAGQQEINDLKAQIEELEKNRIGAEAALAYADVQHAQVERWRMIGRTALMTRNVDLVTMPPYARIPGGSPVSTARVAELRNSMPELRQSVLNAA